MMKRIPANTPHSVRALELVEHLQSYFAQVLSPLSDLKNECFKMHEWLRHQGVWGGGTRLMATDFNVFNRASINVSQVQYEGVADKKLSSATAISTIIHPRSPHWPSVHIHFSWTEMKGGQGYWRMMADLNPSIENDHNTNTFKETVKMYSGEYYEQGLVNGDQYFEIADLSCHRGVFHFYLESFNSGSFDSDYSMAKNLCENVMATYANILKDLQEKRVAPNDEDRQIQLDYHSLYFYQVLTLDRGTTSGLLVHDENDIGILASLPSHVNRELLLKWKEKTTAPQNALVSALVNELEETEFPEITDDVKKSLCRVIREHYSHYPEAINMQAKASIVPPTIDNHK